MPQAFHAVLTLSSRLIAILLPRTKEDLEKGEKREEEKWRPHLLKTCIQ